MSYDTEQIESLLKEIERLKEENQKLEDLQKQLVQRNSQIMGELAVQIADLVRNPLTTVKGLLQIIESENEKHKSLIQISLKEIDAVDQMIKYLLFLSDHKSIYRERYNINTIIEFMMDELNCEAQRHQHTIKFHLDPMVTEVLVDQEDIIQLMICLVRNGLEAMENGDVLTITTKDKQQYIEVIVQDHGSGINCQDFNEIYEPLYSTKKDQLGLGLPIIQTILKRNGGESTIHTIPGVGTTFSIRFYK